MRAERPRAERCVWVRDASDFAHAEDDVRVVVARARRPAPLDPHRRIAELPLLEVGRLDAVAARALGAVLLGVDLEDDVLVGVLLRADADQDVVRVERELTRAEMGEAVEVELEEVKVKVVGVLVVMVDVARVRRATART